MTSFAGRAVDLARLAEQLQRVSDSGRGTAIALSGRRRVGKSRLVQEFANRAGVPYLLFQATSGRNPDAERADFVDAIGQAAFPRADLVRDLRPADWNQALRALATALPDDGPSTVVIDEVPWLVAQDSGFEGALQTIWDQHLSTRPVLLILVGSDLSVMEALQTYGRPFYGRAARVTLHPLNPHDVGEMTGLDAADAIDACLITGGYPEIVRAWSPGMTRHDYLRESVADPLSPLLAAGELSMLGEFPDPTYARQALEAIGAGETTFSAIASHVGGGAPVPAGSLSPALATLIDKRVVTADLPLSTKRDTRNKRYRVADYYLRFWLTFLRRGIAEAERGRGDLILNRIERSWSAWRGRAVEPLVRESLERILPDDRWPGTESVGGWWNRQNRPELDLVGADGRPAREVHFVGSIKWLERPFDRRDLDALVRDLVAVPGAETDTPTVAVSRGGFEPGLPLALRWGPDDLVGAWAPG